MTYLRKVLIIFKFEMSHINYIEPWKYLLKFFDECIFVPYFTIGVKLEILTTQIINLELSTIISAIRIASVNDPTVKSKHWQ